MAVIVSPCHPFDGEYANTILRTTTKDETMLYSAC